ncbi:MAG: hypothetical protein LQ350_002427 [Teloschistes chrysophthalmus]|nr:MAG: hypothetical protein LQ350_002427 [Niorma chrysophthalma]
MAARSVFSLGKGKQKQLREYYGETTPEFARTTARGKSQIPVLLASAFDVDTKNAGVDEFRTILTARTWDHDFSFWTIDLQDRRIIVKYTSGTVHRSARVQLRDDEEDPGPAPADAPQARFSEVDADDAQANLQSYPTANTQPRNTGANGVQDNVDGHEYIVDGFADEAGEVHHFKQWPGHELGFNHNALAVAGKKKKTAHGDSSAPSASRPQEEASTQSLAIVPAKAVTSIALLSEDETVEQRPWTTRTQLGKNVETPLPEHAYAGFGKRIRKIHVHYLPALPPFIEVSKTIRICLRVKVILAKPDGSYPPTDQVSDSETWVTSRWWDTTCIYWTLDSRDRREIVSARLHGVRQIWRRWRDIARGYDPVPFAYGQIRNSRRRELYRNSSPEDESSARTKPRARTGTTTSAAHGHEPQVPTVVNTPASTPPKPPRFTEATVSATEPGEAGILATADPSRVRQWHPQGTETTIRLAVKERDRIGWVVASPHEHIYLTGSNSVPLGNKERLGRLARTYTLDKNSDRVVSPLEEVFTTEPESSDAGANFNATLNNTRSTVERAFPGQVEASVNRPHGSPGDGVQSSTTMEEPSSNAARMLPPSEIQRTDPALATTAPQSVPIPSPNPDPMPPLLFTAQSQVPMQRNSNPLLAPTQIPPQLFPLPESGPWRHDPNPPPTPIQPPAQNTQTAYPTSTQTPPQNLSTPFYPPPQTQSPAFPSHYPDPFHTPPSGFPMPFPPAFQTLPNQSIQMPPYGFQSPQYPPHQPAYPTQPNARTPFHHQQHQIPQPSFSQMPSTAAAFQMPNAADVPMPPTTSYPPQFSAPQNPTSSFSSDAQQNEELRNLQDEKAQKRTTLLQVMYVYEARSRLYDTYLASLAEWERELSGG